MLEKQPYPWKLKSEELPPTLKADSSLGPSLPRKTPWAWIGGSLAGVALLIAFMGWQTALVQTDEGFTLPKPSSERSFAFQVLPSPTRFTLWAQPALSSNNELLSSPPVTSISPSPAPDIPAVLFTNQNSNVSMIPVNLTENVPTLPEAPTFALMGIAKGVDGIIATIKVKDGNNEEVKDVRLGAPLTPSYTVTQISDEYVLLKASQGGKTLRVD